MEMLEMVLPKDLVLRIICAKPMGHAKVHCTNYLLIARFFVILTTSNGYYCSSHTLIYINYIFDCVAAVGSWTMTAEGKFCRETIAEDFKDGLVVCEAYCEENGAKTLSFNTVANTNYDQYYCRCCTESSELKDASCYEHSCNQMYTLLGKYMYLASTNWFRNI